MLFCESCFDDLTRHGLTSVRKLFPVFVSQRPTVTRFVLEKLYTEMFHIYTKRCLMYKKYSKCSN
jgi:hypothetical protein